MGAPARAPAKGSFGYPSNSQFRTEMQTDNMARAMAGCRARCRHLAPGLQDPDHRRHKGGGTGQISPVASGLYAWQDAGWRDLAMKAARHTGAREQVPKKPQAHSPKTSESPGFKFNPANCLTLKGNLRGIGAAFGASAAGSAEGTFARPGSSAKGRCCSPANPPSSRRDFRPARPLQVCQ